MECVVLMLGLQPHTLAGGELAGRQEGRNDHHFSSFFISFFSISFFHIRHHFHVVLLILFLMFRDVA